MPNISRARWKADQSWMRVRERALAEKRVDTASVFLQSANHQEARSTPGFAVGGSLCRAGRRAAAGDSAPVVISSPNRNDCRRSARGAGDSRVHAFASPGKMKHVGLINERRVGTLLPTPLRESGRRTSPPFVLAQILGASAAFLFFRWMIPPRINAESGAAR